jgi:hypothetical protein
MESIYLWVPKSGRFEGMTITCIEIRFSLSH